MMTFWTSLSVESSGFSSSLSVLFHVQFKLFVMCV